MTANVPVLRQRQDATPRVPGDDLVTVTVEGQLFGIPVLQVQDVLGPQKLTRIPLAPPEVAGCLNLRGRIVTAIDIRLRLGLPPRPSGAGEMSIVLDHRGELYSLIVDRVGEVLNLPFDRYEDSPITLDSRWRDLSNGICRLDEALLVVLDVAKLLDITDSEGGVMPSGAFGQQQGSSG